MIVLQQENQRLQRRLASLKPTVPGTEGPGDASDGADADLAAEGGMTVAGENAKLESKSTRLEVYSAANSLGLDSRYVVKLRNEMISSRLALLTMYQQAVRLHGPQSTEEHVPRTRKRRRRMEEDVTPIHGETALARNLVDVDDIMTEDTQEGGPIAPGLSTSREASGDEGTDADSNSTSDSDDPLPAARRALLEADVDRRIAQAHEHALDMILRRLDDERTELGQYREAVIAELLARGIPLPKGLIGDVKMEVRVPMVPDSELKEEEAVPVGEDVGDGAGAGKVAEQGNSAAGSVDAGGASGGAPESLATPEQEGADGNMLDDERGQVEMLAEAVRAAAAGAQDGHDGGEGLW